MYHLCEHNLSFSFTYSGTHFNFLQKNSPMGRPPPCWNQLVGISPPPLGWLPFFSILNDHLHSVIGCHNEKALLEQKQGSIRLKYSDTYSSSMLCNFILLHHPISSVLCRSQNMRYYQWYFNNRILLSLFLAGCPVSQWQQWQWSKSPSWLYLMRRCNDFSISWVSPRQLFADLMRQRSKHRKWCFILQKQ